MFIVNYFLSQPQTFLEVDRFAIHTVTQNPPTSRLTDLPTELLLTILHHLETSAFSSLARTCRHLNVVTESIHLKRLGLVDVETLCVLRSGHQRYHEQIACLSTSFALTRIEEVVCIMDHNKQDGGEWREMKYVTTRLRHIRHFLARLSFIDRFRIVFTSLGAKWSAPVAREFLSAFFDFLEVVTSKSPSSLQIIHPECVFPNMRFQARISRLSEPVIKLKNSIRGTFLPQTPQVGRGEEIAALMPHQPPISNQTQLTKLELHSDLLLLPPYSSWTASLLQNSRVITLTIFRHRSVNKNVFHRTLFPQLVKSVGISLRNMKVAFDDPASLYTVVENLPLLPSLETLVLGITSLGIHPITPNKPIYLHLANLVSFTGSLEQAAFLFGYPMACTKLSYVNLIIDLYYEISTNLYPEKARCFTVINNALSEQGITPKVALCISTEGQPRPLNFFTPTDHPDSAVIFSRVTSLSLEIPLVHPEDEHVEVLRQKIVDWLVIFHAVTAMTVIIRPFHKRKKSSVQRPQNERREERNSRLTSAIASKSPNITCNIVDLPLNRYHFHWSNARHEVSRAMGSGLPPISAHRQKLTEWCVCSDF